MLAKTREAIERTASRPIFTRSTTCNVARVRQRVKKHSRHSFHLIWPHFSWTGSAMRRPSSPWLRPIKTKKVALSMKTARRFSFWLFAATANWVDAQRAHFRGNKLRWDETELVAWYKRYLTMTVDGQRWTAFPLHQWWLNVANTCDICPLALA